MTSRNEANPAGYAPGEGDAYDYIPAWMEIPKLYQTENRDDPLAVVKLFTPDSNWTWYVIEYDSQDTAFGLVVGHETEMGYFSISEIRDVKGPLGLPIERDLWFRPTPVTQLPEYQEKWGARGGPYEGAPEPETLTCEEAQTILDRNYAPLPEGWTVADIAYLLEQLEKGPILVADSKLGIPTIHNVAGSTTHCGMGLMQVEGAGYTLRFDAGSAMRHTPSGKSWSTLNIEGEGYSYDFDGVRAVLESYLASAGSDKVEIHTLAFGDNGVQVYFEGEKYLLLDPYLEENGERYATGWVWRYRDESTGGEWRCLPDPEAGPDTCIGAFSLREAVAYAGRVTGDRFELVGAPDDLPDSYPVHETWDGNGKTPQDVRDLTAVEKAPLRLVPRGSLRIVYLDDAPDGIVWTGDVRSFRQYSEGSEGLRRAFDFLNAVKGHIEAAHECRVVAIQKDFGKGVHARIEPAKTGSECPQIEGWEGFNLALTPASNLADELGYTIRNCYAEPGAPDDWNAPGLHLAQHIRALIRQAYTALQERDGKVFWEELWAEFDELSRADRLLGRVEQVWLWSRERFLEGMNVEVIERQSWTYRKPDERRLAKKYRGDRDNLMAALGAARNNARLDDILSELADLGALPDGYVPLKSERGNGRAGSPDPILAPAPVEETKDVEPVVEQASPDQPEEEETDEIAPVSAPFLEKAKESYSAAIITGENRIRKPFSMPLPLGGLWVCTSASHGAGLQQVDCRQVVPLEEYEGDDAWRGEKYERGYTGRIVRCGKQEYVITGRKLALEPSPDEPAAENAQASEAGGAPGKPAEQPDTDFPDTGDEPDNGENEPARKARYRLPGGIPEAIEVDLGHTHGWAQATASRVQGKWLYYRLDDDETKVVDKHNGKVQVYGRGIVWRVPEGETTDVSNN